MQSEVLITLSVKNNPSGSDAMSTNVSDEPTASIYRVEYQVPTKCWHPPSKLHICIAKKIDFNNFFP
jgi:hypothetical protein